MTAARARLPLPLALIAAAGLLSACTASRPARTPPAPPAFTLFRPEPGPELSLGDARSGIEALLAGSGLARDSFALSVRTLAGAGSALAFNEDQPMTPASNAKLATTAAALAILGPAYRFRTEVSLSSGALHIKGYGDPTLGVLHLKDLVRMILADPRAAGFRGPLVLDDSFFQSYEQIHPGFNRADAFNTGLGPLGVEEDRVVLTLSNEGSAADGTQKLAVRVTPDPEGFTVIRSTGELGFETHYKPQFQVEWDGEARRHAIALIGPLEPGRQVLAIRNATEHFGRVFARVAEAEGLAVTEVVRGEVPRGARRLFSYRSRPLYEILRDMNQESDNYVAEMVLLTVGAAEPRSGRAGPPSLEDGTAAASRFLVEKVGFAAGSFTLENGSGLSRLSRFSPAQLARLLAFMARDPKLGPVFETTLPIAGWSGTLRRRLLDPPALLRIAAKTGMIDYVNCVSGYGAGAGGGKFAFSLLLGDRQGLELTRDLRPIDREAEAEWRKTTAVNDRFKRLADQVLDILSRTRF